MRQSKQIISAVILAPVIVLLISVYSNVVHILFNQLSDFFYENHFMFIPLSVINILVLVALVFLPTLFVTRKFRIKPIHTIISCVIIYLIYSVVPFLPFVFIEISGYFSSVSYVLSSWIEVLVVSFVAGVIMFVTCYIANRKKDKTT
ncbi:MAG: hypothetical protein IJZ51_06150 [Ruminiclostridium sp.]|nr:hypothetical protein [Ruminiclostridium sp.]